MAKKRVTFKKGIPGFKKPKPGISVDDLITSSAKNRRKSGRFI